MGFKRKNKKKQAGKSRKNSWEKEEPLQLHCRAKVPQSFPEKRGIWRINISAIILIAISTIPATFIKKKITLNWNQVDIVIRSPEKTLYFTSILLFVVVVVVSKWIFNREPLLVSYIHLFRIYSAQVTCRNTQQLRKNERPRCRCMAGQRHQRPEKPSGAWCSALYTHGISCQRHNKHQVL